MYDYLVVGAGLFGATFAQRAKASGKSVLVIEKRKHIAGNAYTEKVEGINVHRYGAHIFHTNDEEVWEYVNKFATFNDYINSPVANYKGEFYNLPFNMNTFHQMWGVNTAQEAEEKIEQSKREALHRFFLEDTGKFSELSTDNFDEESPEYKEWLKDFVPKNLEQQAISLVGNDIYEKLVKGYTEKQWGRPCTELPSFIIRRLPVRFKYDNNYFNAIYQGIPVGGYTSMVEKMLEGIEVRLGVDYLENRDEYNALAKTVVYTGPIDAYFDHRLGALQYRAVRFEDEILDTPDFQGNAVMNYTDRETPWTRIIEHKWFEFGKDENGNDIPKTVISREYSQEWTPADEPYYPVNDDKNQELYQKYKLLADAESEKVSCDRIIFGGRLGEYKYYDMDQVIASALKCFSEL